jgi:hypothetical protein
MAIKKEIRSRVEKCPQLANRTRHSGFPYEQAAQATRVAVAAQIAKDFIEGSPDSLNLQTGETMPRGLQAPQCVWQRRNNPVVFCQHRVCFVMHPLNTHRSQAHHPMVV